MEDGFYWFRFADHVRGVTTDPMVVMVCSGGEVCRTTYEVRPVCKMDGRWHGPLSVPDGFELSDAERMSTNGD